MMRNRVAIFNMIRRRLAWAACLALGVLGLVACEGAGEDADGDGDAPVVSAPTPPPAPVGELAPNYTAASDHGLEVKSIGVYTGLYGSQLRPVDSMDEVGLEGAGHYSIKVYARPEQRAGLTNKVERADLVPGRRVRVECMIYCAEKQNQWKLGLFNEAAGHLWPLDPETGSSNFTNKPDLWTPFAAEITMPAETAGETQLWILNWLKTGLTFYVDDISLTVVD